MTSPSERVGRTRRIAIRLSACLHGFLSGKVSEESLVSMLRALARDIEGRSKVLEPPPTNDRAAKQENEVIGALFSHWQDRMVSPRSKLTPNRRDKIRARLREGYTPKQLRQAIDACAASDFHLGQNDRGQKYNDLTLIFRNGENVERFLEMGTSQDPQSHESPQVRALMVEAEEALRAGDTDAYNHANARLSAAKAAQRGRAANG